MVDQSEPNRTESSERLAAILRQLSSVQIRFCVARLECKTDKDAAEMIGVKAETAKHWNEDGSKTLVDEAVRLMAYDGVITAMELRRRALAKAMAIKAAGLDSEDERVRQGVATELIEWEMGKATQRSEVGGPDGGAIPLEIFDKMLKKVYGSDQGA